MIFQNFGFNRQRVVGAAAPSFNYVTSGAQVIYDFGNTASYPGSGTTVYDVSGNSGPSATLQNSPTFSSSNGGIMQFAQASSQYWDFTGTIASSATFMYIWKNTDATNQFYYGYPTKLGAYGYILTMDIGGSPFNKQLAAIPFSNTGAGTTFSNAYVGPADITIFHAYSSVVESISSTSTTVTNYIDDGSTLSASENKNFNRTGGPSTSATIYLNRDTQVGDRYANGACMAYLQYDRALSQSEIAQNYNVFASRF
jgi:hypothetical protein